MSLLSEILSSKVRAGVFQHLFDGRNAELHMRELERQSGCSIGTVQTELKKLMRLGLVVSRRDGNRLYLRAQNSHPLYNEICGLVEKTVGVPGRLAGALAEIEDIDCAFVFGSVAKGDEQAHSDIDLMIIGTIGLRALVGKLSEVSKKSGREINPHILSRDEWYRRLAENDHFISNVMKQPKIFIKGGENELGEVAE